MKTILLLCTAIIFFSGCAGPQPFSTIKSSTQLSVTTDKNANLTLQTGKVEGTGSDTTIPVGGIFVPINTAPNPELHFHIDNQKEFMQLLQSELKRLNVFNNVSIDNPIKQTDYQITLFFKQTHFNGRNLQYVLDVDMSINAEGKKVTKHYKADSHRDKSLQKKIVNSAYASKYKAAEELLEMIIPDIQKFILDHQTKSKKM